MSTMITLNYKFTWKCIIINFKWTFIDFFSVNANNRNKIFFSYFSVTYCLTRYLSVQLTLSFVIPYNFNNCCFSVNVLGQSRLSISPVCFYTIVLNILFVFLLFHIFFHEIFHISISQYKEYYP